METRVETESPAQVRSAPLPDRLRALTTVNRLVSSSLDPSVVLPAIGTAARDLMGARVVAFWLADERARVIRLFAFSDTDLVGSDYPVKSLAYGQATVGWVAEHRRARNVPDLGADPRSITSEWWRARGVTSMLAVPIVLDDELLAILALWGERPFTLDADDEALLESFVAQAAVAIRNARLFAASERRRKIAEALAEVGQALAQSLDPDVIAQRIVDSVLELLDLRLAVLYRLDAESGDLLLLAGSGPAEEWNPRVSPGMTTAGRAVLERRPVATVDALTDPGIRLPAENQRVLTGSGHRAVLAVPLIVQDRVIGALAVRAATGRVFADEDIGVLQTFADQAALAMEGGRVHRESEQQRKRLATMVEVARRLTAGLDLPSVLSALAESAALLFEGEVGLWLVEGNELVAIGGTARAMKVMSRRRIQVGERIAGRVAATGEPVVVHDISTDPRLPLANRADLEAAGLHTMLCVPIRLGGRTLGTLNVYGPRGHRFQTEDLPIATTLADQAAVAIENARLYAGVQTQAEALAAKNAELDSFVHVVSHDLKSPLVAIHGMAAMLTADAAEHLDERGRRYLDRIGANVRQMERLIGDLLALSHVGREARATEPIVVNELVDEILGDLAEQIRERGVKVACGQLGTVVAIRTQMLQIWSNLIGNAVKYMGDTPEPRIEIGRADRGDHDEYWVRDNGVGIDPAYHAQVFELFQRMKDVEAEGSGVGLAIVKKIVERAGGHVRLESAKGEGATFFFTWPSSGAPAPSRSASG